MTDQVLDILKLALLGLLYLFFVRVLWTVWTEVRSASDLQPASVAPAQSRAAAAPVAQPAPRVVPTSLVVIEPAALAGTRYRIGTALAIGRDVEDGIQIKGDNFVSGLHAKVSQAAGSVVINDLGSRNGTYLNGNKIGGQSTVHAGARIQIGYTILEAQ